jgi:hypothetical protein
MSHHRCLRGRGGGLTSTTTVCVERTAGGPTFQCIPSVVAESRPQNVWVGLLARRCRAWCSALLHLPRPMAEWSFEAASSLTVAGPRRIHTGLPCYAPRGHPNKACVISRPRHEQQIASILPKKKPVRHKQPATARAKRPTLGHRSAVSLASDSQSGRLSRPQEASARPTTTWTSAPPRTDAKIADGGAPRAIQMPISCFAG